MTPLPKLDLSRPVHQAAVITVMTGLSVLLVVLVKKLFGADTRGWVNALFTGFVFAFLVLVFVGTSMRGPGMDLYAPWNLPTTIE